MKKITARAIGAILAAITLIGCGSAQKSWITDLDEAKAASQKGKKDLLVVFTGSDWNDPSKNLLTAVFTEDFFKKAGKNYVLCNIDIVQDESLMDQALVEKNYGIATTMGIQAMPTALLFTKDGDRYGSATTPEGIASPAEFIEWLGSFSENRDKILKLKANINKSKGTERAKNIDAFMDEVDPGQRQQYADLIREVLTLDASGEAGLRSEYRLQVAYLDAIALYQTGDMENAANCFVTAAGEGLLDPAQVQEAWYMGAYLSALSGKVENATILEWLDKAIAADPENPGVTQIRSAIEQIKNAPEGATALGN